MADSIPRSSEIRLAKITSPSFQEFLKEHQDGDVTKLLLSKSSINVKEAADQLISRRKSKEKLPDWYAAEAIVFPPPLSIEQSSSRHAAEYKKNLISGNHLIDLTGGAGVDCLALSQVFPRTTYVEKDEWLCTLFRHNHKILSEKEIETENTTAEEYLRAFKGIATFFIDPARRDTNKNKVFRFEDCSPDLTRMMDLLKEKAAKVLIKAAPLIDISLGVRQLRQVEEVHVLSIKNEVKEVLFLLNFEVDREPSIHCINLNETHQRFQFRFSEENDAALMYGQIRKYLYDPNSSILKAGGFKSIAVHFPVQKLSGNTHLYTADERIENFPGRRFEVLDPDLKKSKITRLLPGRKANVFTKNYPLKPEALKQKLGIKDGGDYFVIGFRDSSEKPKIVLAKSE